MEIILKDANAQTVTEAFGFDEKETKDKVNSVIHNAMMATEDVPVADLLANLAKEANTIEEAILLTYFFSRQLEFITARGQRASVN